MKNFFYSLLLILFSILTSCAKDDSSETTNSSKSPFISDIYPLSGLAGTKVFIKGTNLTDGVNSPQVLLNTTSVTPTSSSATTVEFSSPQGGTSGLIELQLAANSQKTKGYNYTYTTKAPSWKILFLIVQKVDYTYTVEKPVKLTTPFQCKLTTSFGVN
ncbi:IPT/TIG domain-containing protein [Flavobacterium laiguense]|nr:IPT/TIG domain-containing protein [Flavobacterium laiguense]